MNRNEILLFLTDQWNDWEASYAVAVANSFTEYVVKTIAIDLKDKESMGGIKAKVDYSIDNYQKFEHMAIVILPGGLSWENNSYADIAEFIKKVTGYKIPIAAICGSTLFLCRHGFLNHVKHTGDSLELFQSQEGYTGNELYIPAQVVVDNGFITANETAAVEFTYQIFKILKIDSEEEIEQWYENFKYGAVR